MYRLNYLERKYIQDSINTIGNFKAIFITLDFFQTSSTKNLMGKNFSEPFEKKNMFLLNRN